MLISQAVYQTLNGRDVAEIPGLKDHPLIVIAHELCFYKDIKDIDSKVPWCSSWMVFETVGEGLKRNAGRMIAYLLKFHKKAFIEKVCAAHNVVYSTVDTGVSIELPKLSAAASSWLEIGESVNIKDAKRGDWVIFVRRNKWRKIIGHHIACLDEDSVGLIFVRVVGANQNNRICSANHYLRTNIKGIRRARV